MSRRREAWLPVMVTLKGWVGTERTMWKQYSGGGVGVGDKDASRR